MFTCGCIEGHELHKKHPDLVDHWCSIQLVSLSQADYGRQHFLSRVLGSDWVLPLHWCPAVCVCSVLPAHVLGFVGKAHGIVCTHHDVLITA